MALLSRISSDTATIPPALGFVVLALLFVVVKYLYHTDTPKIKNLPEIPGLPLFGSLLQFGDSHAVVAQKLAKKYGPVFQVRLGNRVSEQLITFA